LGDSLSAKPAAGGNTYSLTKLNWIAAAIMASLHVIAVWALFHFTWSRLLALVAFHWVVVGLGISIGYHRLLTHRGFKTSKPVEYFLALCGSFALEGGPIFWVATHRVHHQHSDKHGDPHTPREGGFWAHMGWVLFGSRLHNQDPVASKYAPDLGADRFYRWLTTWHWVPMSALGLLIIVFFGWGMAAWVMCLRTVLGLHITWLVNSATHMWGSRRFETRDDSRNSWWVAMLTFGEGWHNNHHAHPVSARHGLTWWELDVSWLTLKLLRSVRLIWDVRVAKV